MRFPEVDAKSEDEMEENCAERLKTNQRQQYRAVSRNKDPMHIINKVLGNI